MSLKSKLKNHPPRWKKSGRTNEEEDEREGKG
jgi:hypothetical protein